MNMPSTHLLTWPILSLAIALTGCGNSGSGSVAAIKPPTPPVGAPLIVTPPVAQSRVGHVFIIVLENKGYDETFGPNSAAPYLSKTLPAQGAMVQNYYGIGHNSLTNYVALISGQGPNAATQADCPAYTDFQATSKSLDSTGQAGGVGCIYPAFVPTIAGKLSAKGLLWKGYMEDMGNDPAREEATCGRPTVNQLKLDQTQSASATDSYAARHNPFVYFHEVIDNEALCKQQVGPLDVLATDLQSVATTPSYSFITPNLCNDAHDSNCKNGSPGGLTSADVFLKKWVPIITSSPAFKQDGLLMVIFDEADIASPAAADATACCHQPTGMSGLPGIFGPGGGHTGAVFLSPFIKPGTITAQAYNHYSLLKSVSSIFGVEPVGYAMQDDLTTFGVDIFNNL